MVLVRIRMIMKSSTFSKAITAFSFLIVIEVAFSLKGLDFLDNFSEDFEALENLAETVTPFSQQLSVCLWVNPTWARRGK